MNISDLAIKSIIGWECGGEAEYNRHPEWPGEQSGITIGIGFDLGMSTATEISSAWGPHVDSKTLEVLVALSGHTGGSAQAFLPQVRHLDISWEAAAKVFTNSTLPTHYARTLRAYPQTIDLHGHCAGALVSLVFNRGPSVSGDRRREMLEIQRLLAAGEIAKIPAQFVAMQRLWPDTAGLRRRRREEAALFEMGLAEAGE